MSRNGREDERSLIGAIHHSGGVREYGQIGWFSA
jgi:hypothetical protein